VLDNEAVQALTDVRHRKHRRALAALEVVASGNLRKAGSVRLVVPAAVRVEAGWDRRQPEAAVINRFRADEEVLGGEAADRAASLRNALDLSVADAHLGAVVEAAGGPVAVLTSDPVDVRRIAAHVGGVVNVVAL
jgi:hypothetical protein